MYRVCTKNFDGTINRVLTTHVFDTYDSACDFVESALSGVSRKDTGERTIEFPLTVRCQREVKIDIISGNTVDDVAYMQRVARGVQLVHSGNTRLPDRKAGLAKLFGNVSKHTK